MIKRVGIVQSAIGEDKNTNLKNALSVAMKERVDFLVFPELFTSGYNLRENLAEDSSGETATALSELAKKESVNVIGGTIIERDGDKFYNTSYVFDRNGNLVGRYSKKNLFKPLGEHKFFSSGLEREANEGAFCLDGINVGVLICYDLRFPELSAQLMSRGTQLIFAPMEWPKVRTRIRENFVRVRAAENCAYLVAANATDYSIDENSYIGGESSIANPSGDCVLMGNSDAGFLVGEIDLDDIKKIKRFFRGEQ